MLLKSLEIRGFKSFADKTELQFKQGVTAVVGPNGSGKSNISDAVRWVLGEQSVKNLRGAKMQDVIFAGTQFRKAVGLAQVSLVLDNEDNNLNIDYSQVKISRRIYRSGESEYFLNNTKCRLKDIQELFMDTGIGKEGYSLIGQGKIDAILSGRADERRQLLEEAAGIVKFKTRKLESEKKLEKTQQNLVRINDILGTYEERIEPLESEKNKAEKFLEYSQELKVKEINLVIDSIEKIQVKMNQLKAKINEKNNDLNDKCNEKEKYKLQLEEWNKELDEFELKYSQEKQTYYSSKSEKESIVSEIKLLSERINLLDEQIIKYKNELKEIQDKLEKVNQEKNNIIDEKKRIAERDKEVSDKINELQNKISNIDKEYEKEEKNINDFKIKHIGISEKINTKNNETIIFQKDLSELENRIEDILFEIKSITGSIKINNNTCIALEDEIKKINLKIESLNEAIVENSKNIQFKRSELTRREKIFNNLQYKLREIDANYKVLVNLNEQFEGYTKSVKVLMNHIKQNRLSYAQGKCWVLGEVITVDKKLETAIEISLGGGISNIITEEEGIAKQLINYLKKNKLGRATFLPLNIVKGRNIQDNRINGQEGYIGVASKLIKYDEKFKNAIDFVLGRTLIVDNMDNALRIAKKVNYSYKIVTLDGEIINPGGSLTGGSIYHKSTNLISRKREIKELSNEKQKIVSEINGISELINVINKDIESIDEEILNLKDGVHGEKIELAKIQTKLNSMKHERQNLEIKLREKKQEQNNSEAKFKVLKEKINDIKIEVKKALEQKESIEKEIEFISNKLKSKNNEIDEMKELLTEYKIKKAQSGETLSNKDRELTKVIEVIEENIAKREKLNFDIKKSIADVEKCKITIENNEIKNTEIEMAINALEENFKEGDIIRIKVKENIKKGNSSIENINNFISIIEKDTHKNQLILAKIESELETLYDKLNQDLKLTYAEAVEYKIENIDITKLNNEIGKLKSLISALGVVNVGAIEEYKELVEKFTFMNSQRNDLMNAKEELENVIEEMTEKMRVVFRENFIKLRKNFDETFKELFKGGSADLILSDGDELTSKIDINVQPPGKKLQNISLMSGGEKVLSAIALLFAILKMKPTPFCILDEIEAALDDANVFRYAEFLKAFSQKIQFIVITHRKGTMQVSDVLYGITMEEKGVSKIVSVDMANK